MVSHAVRVRLYATARDAVRRTELDLAVPDGGLTGRELVRCLTDRWPRLGPILGTSRIVRANGDVVRPGSRLRAGDEVAVHPPYGGG